MKLKVGSETLTVHNPQAINCDPIFDGIDPIGDFHDWRNWRECVGFKGSRLVHCDGNEVKQVTISQAAFILLRLEHAWYDNSDTDLDSHVEKNISDQGTLKWLNLIARSGV